MTGTEKSAPAISDKQVEVAKTLRDNSVGWIGSADSKATTIASVLAVVLGLVSMDMAEASHAANLQAVYWAFLGLGAVSVVFCVATLWPVTNRTRHVGSALEKSPTYFGDVPAEFAIFAARKTSDDDLKRDALEQAFIVARIARRKMVLVRWTIGSFVLTMLTLVLLAFLGSIGGSGTAPSTDDRASTRAAGAPTTPSTP